MRLFSFITSLAVALPPAAAGAEWVRLSGGSGPHLVGVSSPDGDNVFAVGFELVQSGMLPVPVPHAYASADRGESFTEITADLGSGQPMWTPTCVEFLDAQHGFVAGGPRLYRTNTRGAMWASVNVGVDIEALHFFDLQRGVVAGPAGAVLFTADGGQSWQPAAIPTSTDLSAMFWLDAQHGFVAGANRVEETDPESGATVVTYQDGVVLATTDGGATWSQSSPISGLGLGPIFFLAGGETGWLAAWEWVDGDHSRAHLLATTDGGATFTDMGLPLQVGTLQMMTAAPIETSSIATMYWSDALHGHLGGTAFVVKGPESPGGGSSDSLVWRTVGYATGDGGATWTKTDLGTIIYSFGAAQPPPSDGAVLAGEMRSLYRGWMVGERRAVWAYDSSCAVEEDCAPGYTCAGDACELDTIGPATCDPPCVDGQQCVGGVCEPDATTCDPPCADGQQCVGGNCVSSDPGGSTGDGGVRGRFPDDGGCACTTAAPSGWAVLLLLSLAARRLARRSRSHG